MPIMISLDGMATEVPEPRINDFRKLGYRLQAPPIVDTPTSEPPPADTRINLNTATLKDLTTLPLVTTAIAKKVIAARPYESIEDLVSKVEGVDWVSLESKLTV